MGATFDEFSAPISNEISARLPKQSRAPFTLPPAHGSAVA
jgi:hypothetical protein